jgi:DNA-binding transcriptional LysR family regulator
MVQSGSTAEAVAQLHVKQPSVSDRSPQGIRPTIYGDALIECGVAVFRDLSSPRQLSMT